MHSPAEMTSLVFGAVLVILVMTVLCGMLARKVGQPRVVGEMIAGILLGPSLFGWLFPGAQRQLFPPDVGSAIYLLSTLGLVLFMFLVGAGIRSEVMDRSLIRGAALVGTAGVAVPFVLGFGLAWLLVDQIAEPGTPPFQVALLLGGALSVTAFPTLAAIIDERRMEGSRLGSTTLLAASFDDAAAWVLLAITTAIATGGSGSGVVMTLVCGAVFVAAMLTLGRRALEPLARHVERKGELQGSVLVVVLIFVIGAALITDRIGLHFAFGAFVAGIALPRSMLLRMRLRAKLLDVNVGLLLPLFFVYTGLRTEMAGMPTGEVVLPLALIMIAAFVGKYAGCAAVLRLQGNPWRYASAVGGLMNARGLMVLIFINVAADSGMISTDLFTILVLVAVVSTAAAVPIYRLSLPGSLEDAERNRGPADARPHPSRHITPTPEGSHP